MLHTDSPLFKAARDGLSLFAELVKSPEYIHTYRITPLSLWNAAACGVDVEKIIDILNSFSRFAVPENILFEIRDYFVRYGQLQLEKNPDDPQTLLLTSQDEILLIELMNQPWFLEYAVRKRDARAIIVDGSRRGHLKQALIRQGLPVEDTAGYQSGKPLSIQLNEQTLLGEPLSVRYYQEEAADSYWAGGSTRGGSGVVVLPCGAGKTMVGMAVMARVKEHTLILVTNTAALHQWRDELLDKTNLRPSDIGEYSGELKEFKPVTITTYQILTYRRNKEDDFVHMHLFNKKNWGLVIYDEVHLLPAPVFRFTAEIQSMRRLGLTATLVREDGREEDVFSLIGPKKYDVPWKVLEEQKWIAKAECVEIRLPLPEHLRMEYALSSRREKYRVAASNPAKIEIIEYLADLHKRENILVIGQYLDQLKMIAERLKAPLITGRTPNAVREKLYDAFRIGEEPVLIVSKVANFAIDLPCAGVAIQVSGTFGSRQEEAQRLGRILRPKTDQKTAWFYSLVTRETIDQKYAVNRQLFLTEQGYQYHILNHDQLDKLPYRP